MDERAGGNEGRLVKKGLLLDSNIAIGLLNDNIKIVETIQSLYKDNYEFYFSVITKCELVSGAKTDQEMQAIMSIEEVRFIDVNNEIATKAGEIRLTQKKEENRVIKAPDSLIIATAILKKYDLYTLDKGMLFAHQYGVHIIKES
jgi:tRNA(fMet)-specific endonuclease VapC